MDAVMPSTMNVALLLSLSSSSGFSKNDSKTKAEVLKVLDFTPSLKVKLRNPLTKSREENTEISGGTVSFVNPDTCRSKRSSTCNPSASSIAPSWISMRHSDAMLIVHSS